MKKYIALTMLLFSALNAAPVGNAAAPQIIQKGIFSSCNHSIDFRAGYEGDFVQDARLEQYNQGHGRVDTYEQWTNSGTFTFNFFDRMDLYGVFGSSWTTSDWRYNNNSLGTINRVKLKTEDHFLWAVGGRVIACDWWNVSLGMGGRYTSCNYPLKWATLNGALFDTAGSQFQCREWQLNLDLSYKVHSFIPYIGTKYSNARTDLNGFPVPISQDLSGSNSFKNRASWGLYVGCTLSTGNYFMLNIEGRVIDEEAITASCDFRF
jgi:hypothetical protein